MPLELPPPWGQEGLLTSEPVTPMRTVLLSSHEALRSYVLTNKYDFFGRGKNRTLASESLCLSLGTSHLRLPA